MDIKRSKEIYCRYALVQCLSFCMELLSEPRRDTRRKSFDTLYMYIFSINAVLNMSVLGCSMLSTRSSSFIMNIWIYDAIYNFVHIHMSTTFTYATQVICNFYSYIFNIFIPLLSRNCVSGLYQVIIVIYDITYYYVCFKLQVACRGL